MFSSKSFIMLVLIFRSLVINFYTWCELGVQLHFFVCGNALIPAPFVYKIIFPILNCLGIFSKLTSCKFKSLFHSLNSIPWIYMSILILMLYCLDYYSFAVLKSVSISLLSLLFLRIVLTILGLLHFHIGVSISLSNAKKKKAMWILMGIVLQAWITLGRVVILRILTQSTNTECLSMYLDLQFSSTRF